MTTFELINQSVMENYKYHAERQNFFMRLAREQKRLCQRYENTVKAARQAFRDKRNSMFLK